MKRILLLAPMAGLLIAADSDKQKGKDDPDKEKLQGTWTAMSHEAGGQKQDGGDGHTLTFDGNKFTIKKNEETEIEGTYTIDSSKKPKHIDVKIEKAKENRHEGDTAKGIYELKEDTLRWCTEEPGGGERPDEFTTQDGSNACALSRAPEVQVILEESSLLVR